MPSGRGARVRGRGNEREERAGRRRTLSECMPRGSNPLIEEFYKKDTEGCVKTCYKSYDFIVDDCPPLRRAFVSSRKKWNAANYGSITLISEIILRRLPRLILMVQYFVINN
ncbi:hypothetical protein ALC53_03095 [Atta colombica]|uniref:Uncharacterized protein n=1 Tax=Atta colombica TaxID=520822 RepID=A0A195BRP4_9HYME|nr:hypothetical protein ALC53_03095 [Atta colombica]